MVRREGFDAVGSCLGAKAANDGARFEVSDSLQQHVGGAEQSIDRLAICALDRLWQRKEGAVEQRRCIYG